MTATRDRIGLKVGGIFPDGLSRDARFALHTPQAINQDTRPGDTLPRMTKESMDA